MIYLIRTPTFKQTVQVITLNNPTLKPKIVSTLILMQNNPFYSGLKTKKVYTKKYGQKWSSVVKNDIRIIWDFYQEKGISRKIRLLTIGTNKEPLRVYKN